MCVFFRFFVFTANFVVLNSQLFPIGRTPTCHDRTTTRLLCAQTGFPAVTAITVTALWFCVMLGDRSRRESCHSQCHRRVDRYRKGWSRFGFLANLVCHIVLVLVRPKSRTNGLHPIERGYRDKNPPPKKKFELLKCFVIL